MMTFWTTIVAPLIVGIVLLAISKLLSKDKDDNKPRKSFTMRQINITNITNHYPEKKQRNSNNSKKESDFVLGVVLFGGLFLDKAVPYITAGILIGTFFILGLFLYSVFYSYQRGIIHGESWTYFLLATVLITMLTGFLALNLMEPINVIEQTGQNPILDAISKVFAPSYRAIGVLFIGIGMYVIAMTQIHYLSGLKVFSGNSQNQLAYRIFNKTKRFERPWMFVGIATALFIIAFLFINNFIYQWVN